MCSQYIGSNTSTATCFEVSRNLPSVEDVELFNAVLDICKEDEKWWPYHDTIAGRRVAKLRSTCPTELLDLAQERLDKKRGDSQALDSPAPIDAQPKEASPRPAQATVQQIADCHDLPETPLQATVQPPVGTDISSIFSSTMTAQAEQPHASAPQPPESDAAMLAEALAQLGVGQNSSTPASGARRQASGGKKAGPAHRITQESYDLLRDICSDFVMFAGKGQTTAYHIQSGDQLTREGFEQYCAKHYGRCAMINDDGSKSLEKSGKIWWEWELPEKRVVRRIVMEPTEKPEADDPAGSEVFNRWHMLKQTMIAPNLQAGPNDCAILFNHLMYLSDGDKEGVTYFLNWLAQLYQTPSIKIPTAIMFYSRFGQLGKTSLYKLLSKVFGEPLSACLNGKVLGKQFWDPLEHKRIVLLNELARVDKQDSYEWFKNLISEKQISLEGKGKTEKEVKNFMHFIITTNNLDALPLMQDDPRILVMKCESLRNPDDYYTRLHAWLDGEGPANFAGLLAKWQFPEGWNPYAPVPQTAASKAAQQAARSPLVVWLEELSESREAPFDKDLVKPGTIVEQLGAMYPAQAKNIRLSAVTVGKVLRELGYVELKSGTSSTDRYLCRSDRFEFWDARGPTAWKKYFKAAPQEAQRIAAETSIEPNVTRH